VATRQALPESILTDLEFFKMFWAYKIGEEKNTPNSRSTSGDLVRFMYVYKVIK